jgi:small subunit ribosomal protein S16
MVKIRLARGGAKKKPFYSIVVTDSRKRRDSAYIERFGYFNPVARGQEVRLIINEDRLAYWTSEGAQISDRVKQLIKEFKDPSIREKCVATQQANAVLITSKLVAKADEEAKVEAEEKAVAEKEKVAEVAETTEQEALLTEEEKTAE